MAHHPNESASAFVAAFPSAVLAWLVMMAAGLALGTLLESRLGHVNSVTVEEYVIAFLLAMPAPFALVIAIVDIPLVLGVRAVSSGTASPLVFGAACIIAAPLAGLVLLAIGSLMWGPPRIAGGYVTFVPTLLAIAVGGLAFGFAFGRTDRRSRFSN